MANLVPTKHSTSISSRMSSIDVSQLDKINAIPNKNTNSMLMSGLCQEDKLYLNALIDEDSPDSEENAQESEHGAGSPWSPPMAQRSMGLTNKRIKRMKPAYTITLSLEDISYIRPSWGMSKGIKKIDVNKKKKKKAEAETKTTTVVTNSSNHEKQNQKSRANTIFDAYHISLIVLLLILSFLILLSYFVDLKRNHERIYQSRSEIEPSQRILKIMKVSSGTILTDRTFKVFYGRGIPKNLKHEECTCEMFEAEMRRYLSQDADMTRGDYNKGNCYACLDWELQANFQVLVNRNMQLTEQNSKSKQHLLQTQSSILNDEDLTVTCYDVKWQSYNTLHTPLVDCFQISESDQWFGLGDIQSSIWPLNKHKQFDYAPLVSNLSGEFGPFDANNPAYNSYERDRLLESLQPVAMNSNSKLVFGSHVDLKLLTSSGIFVGNIKTDFQPSIQISAERREVCLSVSCTDRCTQTWSKLEDVDKFKHYNNLLEYSICSASNRDVLISRLIKERLDRLNQESTSTTVLAEISPQADSKTKQESKYDNLTVIGSTKANNKTSKASSSIEQLELSPALLQLQQVASEPGQPSIRPGNGSSVPQVATKSGIGIVERTLFITSPEHIPNLDGQTLRQHVDKIIKLNLKTSPILVLDTRWQTYIGAFRMDLGYFPKVKLLFEILHNKGFKLVLSVKPYIDAGVGISYLNQLLGSNRLVTGQYFRHHIIQAPLVAGIPLEEATSTNLNSSPGNVSQVSTAKNGTQSELQQENFQDHAAKAVHRKQIIRRQSFFRFKNETVLVSENHLKSPYLFKCKEAHDGHCVLIDLQSEENRAWLISLIKRSSFLTQDADGILFAGTHPDSGEWDCGYRAATAELVDQLFYKENLYVIPQWSGNFNYIQLAPRQRDWDSLRSTVNSVLTLSALGFSLVHPGSVWGDLSGNVAKRTEENTAPGQVAASSIVEQPATNRFKAVSLKRGTSSLNSINNEEEDLVLIERRAEEELIVRWLQVAVFLPILQFNDLSPIDKFNLHDQLQQLVRIRKMYIAPEIKRNTPYTPLLRNNDNNSNLNGGQAYASLIQPALRQTMSQTGGGRSGVANNYNTNGPSSPDSGQPHPEAVSQQFMIGPDLLIAPVLVAGQRQKDIYLPAGMWHDELFRTNIRGGKWMRNYPIELNEIAWFTRARR